ncbi:GAF domain-containing protein [Pseudonocardia sp. T1-2H]|uniref:GAF domain-containing protein n=1 Tax=Pseudonocardia sp. T1-2H TaxID=3128899 RepID=UPI003100ABDE
MRRVATLVARGLPPAEVLAAVAHEVGHVLGADATTIARLDPDDAMTVVAVAGGHSHDLAVGSRWTPQPPLALAVALRTGHPARCDDYSQASGAFVDATVRPMGIRSSVAAPITVEGHLWGAIVAGTRRAHLPADTEQRMVGFTELIATAIANVDSPPDTGPRSSSNSPCNPTNRTTRRCGEFRGRGGDQAVAAGVRRIVDGPSPSPPRRGVC